MSEKSYDELAQEYKDTVLLRLRGKFYNAFDDSAKIIGELLGYKVRAKNGRCRVGFPVESFEKVIDCLKRENVNTICFDGETKTAEAFFENNQYQSILKDFDDSSIEYTKKDAGKSEFKMVQKSSESEIDIKEQPNRQLTSFIQGQGVTLENAIMDAQRVADAFIAQGKRIVSVTLIENRSTALKDAILVQGIIVYENF